MAKEAPRLRIPQRIYDEVIRHSLADLPNECCGVLAGNDGQIKKGYPIKNLAESPFRFDMNMLQYMRAEDDFEKHGWSLNVIYHSHVASEARPSPTDLRMSLWPDSDPPMDRWPDAYWVVIGLSDQSVPEMRAFSVSLAVATEVAFKVGRRIVRPKKPDEIHRLP